MVPNRATGLKLSQSKEKRRYNREILPRSSPWWFYIKLYMFIFTKEKSPPPPQVFLSETLFLSKTWILFSMEFHSHCCLFIQKRFIFDFFLPCLFVFIIFFPEHQNTIKFINFITYGRAIHLLHIWLYVIDWVIQFHYLKRSSNWNFILSPSYAWKKVYQTKYIFEKEFVE